MRSVNWAIWRDVKLVAIFACAALVNLGIVSFLDSWRQRKRGSVSDGGIEFLDAIALIFLALTLLGLRIRSRDNVGMVSVIACGLAPGIVLLLYLFVF